MSERPALDPAPLRAALRGEATPHTEVLRGERPPLLDAAFVRALTSALMLALVVAACVFRARTSLVQFDLALLVLRTLALAFAVRAVFAVARWGAAFAADGAARESALVLGEHALLARLGTRELVVARADVLAIVPVVHSAAQSRVSARGDVFLVRSAPLAPVLLPAWFATNHEVLTARLRRWLGPAPGARAVPSPEGDPERRYVDIAQGKREPDAIAIPEGRGYMERAPYAALLGLAFVADAVLHAGSMRALLLVPASAACVLASALFIGWFVWLARRRATRLGVGLVLTGAELLARGKGGVVAVPWAQLAEVDVDLRNAWSPLFGALSVRTLGLRTHDGQTLLFDGGFLGYPVEVVAALCEAYREGRATPDAAQARAS